MKKRLLKFFACILILNIFFLNSNIVRAKDLGNILFIGHSRDAIKALMERVSFMMYKFDRNNLFIGRSFVRTGRNVTLNLEEIHGNVREKLKMDGIKTADITVIVVDLKEENCFDNFEYWIRYAKEKTSATEYIVAGINCDIKNPEGELLKLNKAIENFNSTIKLVKRNFMNPPSWFVDYYSESEIELEEHHREIEQHFQENSRFYKFFSSNNFVINIPEAYNTSAFKGFISEKIDSMSDNIKELEVYTRSKCNVA